jgi:Fe-S cluster assembly iron-binding protein IscA
LALDEPKDSDHVYDIDGFQYLVNKEFMEKVKPIKVDYLQMGFKIDCGIDFGAACSSCGTKGSCCD